jgi:hypothetical protein
VQGNIVAAGTDTQAIIAEATRKVPGITWRDVVLISVPQSLNVVYLS